MIEKSSVTWKNHTSPAFKVTKQSRHDDLLAILKSQSYKTLMLKGETSANRWKQMQHNGKRVVESNSKWVKTSKNERKTNGKGKFFVMQDLFLLSDNSDNWKFKNSENHGR